MSNQKNTKKIFKLKFEEAKTLREKIYIYLRDAITNNDIPPGERIYEKQIAEDFNVSITPVREAILQLSMEGFIEVTTHKNIIVKQISLLEVNDIYEVQAALEGFAGRLATLQLNDKHLNKMEKLIEKMEKYYDLNNIDKFYELNETIHELYLKQSGNQLINDIISNIELRKKMFRYRITFLSKKEIMKKAIDDHKNILKGFLSRNPDEVERLIRDHWTNDTRIEEFRMAMRNESNNEKS